MEYNKYKTGAVREKRTGKGRFDLIPPCVMLRLAKYYESTVTEEHPAHNWENGFPTHELLDSAFRHLYKYMDGQTSEDHLCASVWNIFACMFMEDKLPEMQDIPSRLNNERNNNRK